MSGSVSSKLRDEVRRFFEARCAYCQTAESLTVAFFEIEHIIPRSKGGATEFPNLCLACPTCNRFKADRTAGMHESGVETRLFHPHRDRWQDHFDWTVDGTSIVGLTEVAEVTIDLLRMNRPQLISVRSLWVDAGRHPPS